MSKNIAPQQGLAEVNGARLYYEVAGSGVAVALIHGFANDTRAWDDQFAPLAQHYRVVRYDLRGFGRSSLPGPEPYSHADDLRALLDHLGMSNACLVGRSMGGDVALAFALAHPEATRALVLQDSTLVGFRWSQEWRDSLREVSRVARESGMERARESWLQHPLFRPAREKPDLAERVRQSIFDYSGWHWVNRDPAQQPDPPTAQQLDRVLAPTLVVVGERDLPDFLAIAELLAGSIPGARRVTLPGVGHLSNAEDPTGFNQALLDFLASIP